MDKKECCSCVKEPKDRINAIRLLSKLDEFFKTNDLAGAGDYLRYWEKEAESLFDKRGLLTVLNEELGYYRRTNEPERGITAVRKAASLIDELGMNENASAAVIFVNMATTLKAFGKAAEGIAYYEQAEKIMTDSCREQTYDFAAMLNNKASSLCDMGRLDEAEECYKRAIAILDKNGEHDGEIAVSYVNLAHLYFDRDGNAYEQVEKLLDTAWEYINSERQPHDANYAFILSKCAPSFEYFKRFDEAEALKEVAREIYEGN